MTLLSCFALAHAIQADPGPLHLTLAIPESTMPLGILGTQVNIYVMFDQTGTTPLNLWGTQCSWGYDRLSFELKKTEDGQPISIHRLPRGWDKNFPYTISLLPKRHFIFPSAFGDGTWTPFPIAKDSVGKFWIRAVYSVPKDDMTQKFKAWTGTVTSQWEEVEFRNHMEVIPPK